MSNFKYQNGNYIGPYNILMIQRTTKDQQGCWKGIFECPICKTQWETRISSIANGSTTSCGCKQKEKARQILLQYNLSDKNKLNLKGQRFGKLLALEPTNQRKNHQIVWKCKCDCGNICYVKSNFLSSGMTQSCGCLNSKGEEKITQILLKLNIIFYKEYQFIDCINPKTNTKLRFDFYLPDYNCCIEYDGKQHYINSWEPLRNVQYRDQIKNEYCKIKNIHLIRIPYTDFNILNTSYIKQKLEDFI